MKKWPYSVSLVPDNAMLDGAHKLVDNLGGRMNNYHIQFRCDSRPLEEALASLAKVAERSREIVQRFLDSLDSESQLVRLDSDGALTPRAGEYWIVFQPSDLLVEFLAAARTGERDGV